VVWLACLVPLGDLVYRAWNVQHGAEPDLGANPLEYITLSTGFWTLFLLVTSLAITPLRKVTSQNWLIKFRRLIGLFAFFYGCLHFTTYIWFDKEFQLPDMIKDLEKRPFIMAGFAAFLTLIPLAATSTNWAIRKMGGKNWNRLHKLVYFSAIAGVVHFFWKVKAGYAKPIAFAVVLGVLLGWRVLAAVMSSKPKPAAA
jgi:sulfoxide reductase heme-binding subunit YedZ